MLSRVLETPVDSLVEIVRDNGECSIAFLKKQLKVETEVIEKWVVILEEYGILKVRYKGLEGYVEINKKKEIEERKGNELDLDKLKDMFIEKSRKKNLSYEKMKELWPLFLVEHGGEIEEIFFNQARERKISEIKIKKAWSKYKAELEVF